VRLRPPVEQLPQRCERADAVVRQRPPEGAGGLVRAGRPHRAVDLRQIRARVLENELERGEGLLA
jgi:hypothetical protein